MKPKIHFSPSLLLFVIAILILFSPISSCKKIKDVEFKPQHDDLVQKFFAVPEGTSDALKAVIVDIKKQEDKNHFVLNLVPKYGMPAWNKSVSNTSVRNANARSATGDSLQLFLIPFRAADSSVSSYLMCARNGDDFTYRYYKKNTTAQLYAANDTIKRLREGLLSVFSFFEKRINNRDSISIAGVYNETIKDVVLKINDAPVSYGGP